MKKILILMAAILAVVFATLSILGSGGEYAAERLFYRAMKIAQKIMLNPDVAPPAMVTSVENILISVPQKYPRANISKSAPITLAEFYINNKKYDKALAAIKDIFNSEKSNKAILSAAQFLKGNVYERQDRWDKALKEYVILRDTYPDTQPGLQAPLYIGRYYKMKEMSAEAGRAYNDAAIYYEKLEERNRGKALGYESSALLLKTYLTMENYERAGDVVEKTMANYSHPVVLAQLLPYVELIFINKLNNPEKAIEIYTKVAKETRIPKLKEALQKKIDEIKAKKSKSVSI